MAICILVLEDEQKVGDFWENLKAGQVSIASFQVIAADNKHEKAERVKESNQEKLPEKVNINEVKLLNPKQTILTHMNYEVDYDTIMSKVPKNCIAAYDGLKVKV